MDSKSSNPLITKTVIHAGNKNAEFTKGTKVYFHFQTRKCDESSTVIDDSRKMGKPMELVLGKKFRFEVWETIVQMMAVEEVAKFKVDKSLVSGYPFVSKTLRDVGKPEEQRQHHCCGVTLQNEGIGYADLNQLIKEPCDLEFIIELMTVISPEEYEKESWQMSEEEKLSAVPILREHGNNLYREKNFTSAAAKYAQAIGMLEQLMLSEKPGDEEWKALDQMKVPLLLNYSQCKLLEKDYYAVIEHCNTVLKSDPGNVKALFRRAKAHVGAWNPREAQNDFDEALKLDPSLNLVIKREIKVLEELIKEKNEEEKVKLRGKIF